MNDIDFLISEFRKIIKLDIDDEDKIYDSFHVRKLKKREILLFAGDVSTHMQFISKGCLRAYYMDTEAKEHIIQFGIEGWWVNDLYSYLTNTPGKQFLQALEESRVVQIQKNNLIELYDKVPSIERFFRIKFEKAYVSLQDRTINSMSKSAEERYLEFRKKYRDIEQRVPQYMIASYLGITPEFLSKLRNKH